jgi:hypothetical protein
MDRILHESNGLRQPVHSVTAFKAAGLKSETIGEIMRKNRLSVFLFATAIVMLLQPAESTAETASCRSNEYKVMSLLIREQYGEEFSLILINRDTESWCLSARLDVLQRFWPKLKQETIDSLIINNSGATVRLAGRFDLPVEYRLLSDQEYLVSLWGDKSRSEEEILEAGSDPASSGTDMSDAMSDAAEPDWDNFDRVFPDAQGYMTFSRVAFDSECTQALVIFSNAYRCSGNRVSPKTRKIACFRMKNGSWELVGVSPGIDAID